MSNQVFSPAALAVIDNIVQNNRRVNARIEALRAAGFRVEDRPMGSGGIGQIRKTRDEKRVQIGYGVGNHNYAPCVIFPNDQNS